MQGVEQDGAVLEEKRGACLVLFEEESWEPCGLKMQQVSWLLNTAVFVSINVTGT